MIKKLLATAITISALMLPICASAGPAATSDLAVGFQASWPNSGLSVKKDLNEKWTVQGVLGLFGTFSHYGARGLYTLKKMPDYKTYAYGGAGIYSYDYSLDTESVFGASVGAGLEYDLSKHLEGLPLTVGGELGLGLVSFDNFSYSAFSFGTSVHYWLD